MAEEVDDHGFITAVANLESRVLSAPDAEWCAYESLNMGSSMAAGLSHAFGGGSRETSSASSSLQEMAWRVARAYSDQAAQLNQQLDVWQTEHEIPKTTRDGRPPIER